MLGDLKSFVTKSSVGEVAVGLSVGAAFTNVMAELMETGRSLLGGDLQYAGLVQSVLALLAAALFSLVLVIKPLAALKARADRVQTNLVAGATGDDAVVLPVPDDQRVDGFVGEALAEPPPAASTDGAGSHELVVAAADDAAPVVASTVGGYPDGAAESALEPDAVAAADVTGDLPIGGAAPSTSPSAVIGTGSVFHWSTADVDGHLRPSTGRAAGITDEPVAVDLTDHRPTTMSTPAAPHSQRVTKVCPYCAFDIPAVASRCGYCTADLTDAQRSAGVVLVDERS